MRPSSTSSSPAARSALLDRLLLLRQQLQKWRKGHSGQSHAALQSREQAAKAALGILLGGCQNSAAPGMSHPKPRTRGSLARHLARCSASLRHLSDPPDRTASYRDRRRCGAVGLCSKLGHRRGYDSGLRHRRAVAPFSCSINLRTRFGRW